MIDPATAVLLRKMICTMSEIAGTIPYAEARMAPAIVECYELLEAAQRPANSVASRRQLA